MKQIFSIEIFIGAIVILLAFTLFFYKRRVSPHRASTRFFYLYPFLGLLLSAVTVINYCVFPVPKLISNLSENLFTILESVFWGLFFRDCITHFKQSVSFIFVLVLSSIFFFILVNGISHSNHSATSISNLGLSVYACIYFIDIFRRDPVIVIFREAEFWIITGVFFYSAASLPLFPMAEYFKNKGNHNISLAFLAVINLLIIIMYLFFIKAYICLTRRPKA